MSLYHEAVQVLNTASQNGGSIKSVVFSRKDWKSDVKTLFALTTETAKWSAVLSEVIEQSGILKLEKQLTPELALVLTHDLLLAKRGLALPPKHGLAATISRHKARLIAELSKARVKRGFATLETLKADINSHSGGRSSSDNSDASRHPRWIRMNTIRTSLKEQLDSTFASYKRADDIAGITHASPGEKVLYIDEHVPDLLAIPDHVDIVSSTAYRQGQLIIQDKASCFPAVLLDPNSLTGDIMDACAAPGNKTTHLAAQISSPTQNGHLSLRKRKIFACERDVHRSTTLGKMVKLAGAEDVVQIKARQDFLTLDPQSPEFGSVTAILLDPSCSGSGMVGRDEATVDLHLPTVQSSHGQQLSGKKRKRQDTRSKPIPTKRIISSEEAAEEELPDEPSTSEPSDLAARLSALSSFQLRLLKHAMAFPAARHITYSTCSLHDEENEHVVAKALLSEIAVERGWLIWRREQQVQGMRKWQIRGRMQGIKDAVSSAGEIEALMDVDEVTEGCIRCDKGSREGTMGFFVAGFMRDPDYVTGAGCVEDSDLVDSDRETAEVGQGEEWEGFSDEAEF